LADKSIQSDLHCIQDKHFISWALLEKLTHDLSIASTKFYCLSNTAQSIAAKPLKLDTCELLVNSKICKASL